MRSIRISMALLCLTFSACHSWQVQSGPAGPSAGLATADSTKPVRLRLKSGATIDLTTPHVSGDSVVGVSTHSHERVAFAITDVESVAARHVSAGRTALAVAGIAVVAYVILVGIALASLGNSID